MGPILTVIIWTFITGNLVSEYVEGKKKKAKAIKATKQGSTFPTIFQS